MGEPRTPLGWVLLALMDARGIETIGGLSERLRRSGYRRGMSQSVVAQWMRGASKPQSVPKLCFYLDKALQLTEEEKAAVAASVGLPAYPVPGGPITTESLPPLHPHLQPNDYPGVFRNYL